MGTYEIPASVGQRLLAMIDHYRPGHGALNCPVLCRFRGELDAAALRAAVDDLTVRHEALRTTFSGRGPALTQRIHDPGPQPLIEVDLRGERDPQAALDEAVAGELRRRIDATVWPTRATLWRTGAQDHVFCLNMHHLVTDAWSCGVLFAELRALLARRSGEPAPLPDPVWQYRDFVAWQQRLLDGGLPRHRDYWRAQLHGARIPALPYRDGECSEAAGPSVDRCDLAPPVVAGLRQVARALRTTPFAVALALYFAVLRRATGESDLAVASLFANRSRPEAQHTVGFLANMVLLRARLSVTDTFADLVRQVHATVIGAFAHQEQPFQMLPLDTLGSGPRPADDVVFQMMAEVPYQVTAGEVEMELLVPDGIGSRFGLELALAPRGAGMSAVLFTAPRLDPSLGVGILSSYASAAAAVVGDASTPLSRLVG